MPKSHSRLSRNMRNLRPGDVITNLDCVVHRSSRVLVLARRGDTWFDFSEKADGQLLIVRDAHGPWRWDDGAETFVNNDGEEYGHISPDTIVQEGAGLEQVQWYRELPAPESDRWFISPRHMLDAVGDPGTLAKLEAILARQKGADPEQSIRNLSHALELIFAGTGVLDNRRMRLMHVLMHSQSRLSQHERRTDDLLGALFDDEAGELPEGMPPSLAALVVALGGLGQRRDHGGRERGRRQRGNGHDHSAGGMPG